MRAARVDVSLANFVGSVRVGAVLAAFVRNYGDSGAAGDFAQDDSEKQKR
jgi:hypothetical protein